MPLQTTLAVQKKALPHLILPYNDRGVRLHRDANESEKNERQHPEDRRVQNKNKITIMH